jgi:hypothetical protein
MFFHSQSMTILHLVVNLRAWKIKLLDAHIPAFEAAQHGIAYQPGSPGPQG